MPETSSYDSANIPTRQHVYDDAGRAAVWGLGVNLLLVVIKVTGGVLTGSAALLADAVNSVGDVGSALAVRGALHIAQRDEDEDHPYGHSKAESIAGLSVALIIAFSAALLAIETIQGLGETPQPVSLLAGAIAGVCAFIKETAYRYTRRVADRLGATSLRAAALDHRSDAISSAVVAVALLSSKFFGGAAVYVDPIAAIFVCIYLIYVGLKMFASIAAELMDQQADEATTARVGEVATQIDAVENVEKLRVRKSGLEFFAEIHIEVDGHLTVSEGHRIGHDVKDLLLA
ncbi:MAG: cation diffusion facilitator family transporter, partial [Planctomycetaceae bacterium]